MLPCGQLQGTMHGSPRIPLVKHPNDILKPIQPCYSFWPNQPPTMLIASACASLLFVSEQRAFAAMATAFLLPRLRSRSTTVSTLLWRGRFSAGFLGDESIISFRNTGSGSPSSSCAMISSAATSAALFESPLVTVDEVGMGWWLVVVATVVLSIAA